LLLGTPIQVSGVDACKGGWIAVTATSKSFDIVDVQVFTSVAALISELAPRSIIAIDMPIGLPERAIRGGREPDWAAREFLGSQRASVFPVPSRVAVYAHEQGYTRVCDVARETSDPKRAVSKQLFGILWRIRQVDEILRQDPVLRERVFEVHPEVSFKVMNNDEPLTERKKSKHGVQLRRGLLLKEGFSLSVLRQRPPTGVAIDDFYDACACAWSAKRILSKKARVYPCRPPLDGEGMEQAIRT
jgi:predicted RNase H-like nuclease